MRRLINSDLQGVVETTIDRNRNPIANWDVLDRAIGIVNVVHRPCERHQRKKILYRQQYKADRPHSYNSGGRRAETEVELRLNININYDER